MVLARAGNWEMKNIFYYLTNHLNNSQCFCSEIRGAQPAGTNRAVLSRHPRWLIKRVGLRGRLCRRISMLGESGEHREEKLVWCRRLGPPARPVPPRQQGFL